MCNYLATERKLGDPDTFMVKVQQELGEETPAKRTRREAKAEDAVALAAVLVGVVVGVGLATVVAAAVGRHRERRRPVRLDARRE